MLTPELRTAGVVLRGCWCIDVYTSCASVVPPNRRRAGSRPGVVSDELKARLTAEAIDLVAVQDPVARIRAVNDFYAQLEFELDQFAAARLEAVSELRALGWSYDRISLATGLSKARVAQLSRAAKVGGRRSRRGAT
jgi:hypothetical protein